MSLATVESIDSSVAHRTPSVAKAPLPGLKHFMPRQGERRFGELIAESSQDLHFVKILRGLRDSGGLLRGDEIATLMQRSSGQDVSVLARWIVTAQVLCFEWRSEFWVPLFQFDTRDMSRREDVRRVVAELQPAFDAWNLVSWFSHPNSWLGDRAPADVVGSDLQSVLQAARADRFVAMG